MTASDLNRKIFDEVTKSNIMDIEGHLSQIAIGQYEEVYNRSGRPNLYYQWLHELVRVINPHQIVELGAAAGISTIMMATTAPTDCKIYSVDIDPQAWRWMVNDYSQVVKLLGDTRNLALYPEDCQLESTDIWFFDSEHTREQLQSEIDVYKPYWKKGAIVIFDDIHINPGMEEVWNSLEGDKCDNSELNHWSGFGFIII